MQLLQRLMNGHGAALFDNYREFARANGPLDLHRLDAIARLACTPRDGGLELAIDARWARADDSSARVSMVFSGVRDLVMPRLGGHWFGFVRVELRPITGPGDARLAFRDHSPDGISFFCHRARIRAARP